MSTLLAEKNKNKFLLLVLFLALVVRLWVFPVVFSNSDVTLLGADTYYHARRILATVSHFPNALAFDSYIDFPFGAKIGWAPLYDQFIALIAIIIGLGTPSYYTIQATTAIVPLLLGVFTVLLVYSIAGKLFDWRVALISAGIFAITPAHVYVSFLGYADHHVAETLLSTAAYLFFITALKHSQQNKISFGNFKSSILKNSVFPALTGITLSLSIFTWDGAPIFIGLIGIYIIIQFIIDRKFSRNSDYLVLTGGIAFLVSLLIITPVAISQGAGFEIYYYLPTLFHVAFLSVFFLLCVLLGAMQKMQFKKWWHHPLLLLIIFAASVSSLEIFSPQFYQSVTNGISYLLGGGILATIQEAVPLFNTPAGGFTLDNVWRAFTVSFFIALLMLIYFIHKTRKETYPSDAVFLIVWTLIVLALTLLQRRFVYLLAVNVAILSAYFITSVLKLFSIEIKTLIAKSTKRKRKNQKASASVSNTGFIRDLSIAAFLPILSVVVVNYMETGNIPAKDFLLYVDIAILLAYFIIAVLKLFSIENTKLIIGLSMIALLAVHNLTVVKFMATENVAAPDKDLRESFKWLKDNSPTTSYFESPDKPAEYGVMSWWDYGNWILYISQRPVVANNFQTGIDDSARFLTEPDEKAANDIINKRKVRFIVTDAQMLKLKFSSIAVLAGKKAEDYYGASDGTPIRSVNAENEKFFDTMLSKLHVFDGNGLNRYRLIYESNTTAIKSPDIKYVKIFEYVHGATISGKANGEVRATVSIMTNQGRTFVYAQQVTAINGRYEIKVPYSTQGGKYATAPLSDYIIQNANTVKAVSVSENDVLEGREVQVDLI